MPSAFKSIAAADYQAEVVASKEPVVVFFWAPSSDPCRFFIAPLEGYVAARAQRPKLVKVNVDQYPEAARAARIGAIPALLAYREGKVVGELLGTGSKREVERVFAAAIGPIR